MSGLFITFEGVEGGGKSTQLHRLRDYLETKGWQVTVTREPGGPPIAEEIRRILLDPAHSDMAPAAELLLYAAARAQHVHALIEPALAAGRAVLCDRFTDSTAAYQGAGRGVPIDTLDRLKAIATHGVRPDLTLLLDLPVEQGLERTRARGRADRLEGEPIAFHQRVRDGFLRIAAEEPGRVRIIDARGSADDVALLIRAEADALLAARSGRARGQ